MGWSDAHLRWVHKNRQVRRRAVPLSRVVADVLGVDWARRADHRARVRVAIASVVDDEFRAACTLGEVDRRSVVILVEEATLLGPLRRRWLMALVDQLDRCGSFVVTPRMLFRLGRNGDPLDLPPAESDTGGEPAG